MGSRENLLNAIRNNPKDVRFKDACKVARWLGFASASVRGSHHAFARHGEPSQLNFQNRDGKIPPYQAKQLIAMIDKYEPDL